MYEVFITERMKLAAEGYETAGAQQDAFEQKVTALQNRMTGKKLGKTLVNASAKSVSNLTSILRNAGHSVRVSRLKQPSPSLPGRSMCRRQYREAIILHGQPQTLGGPTVSVLHPHMDVQVVVSHGRGSASQCEEMG